MHINKRLKISTDRELCKVTAKFIFLVDVNISQTGGMTSYVVRFIIRTF